MPPDYQFAAWFEGCYVELFKMWSTRVHDTIAYRTSPYLMRSPCVPIIKVSDEVRFHDDNGR
ncbi:Protein of unknown function [Pyronema omphalodes CBS 100304]|uniref:Uncharacterized protein n=1 Tax=Pyronema omphalodes (strain CBS 100304) TaxID=1076935 RepID=U4LHC7_PYROM|nr:Protein of unknown function [Pyronema omphalodes CBS 100304]